MLGNYTLPEDDPLVATTMHLDRQRAAGRAVTVTETPQANWLAISPIPKRILAICSKLAALGMPAADRFAIDDMVRIARAIEDIERTRTFGGPMSSEHNDHISTGTLKFTVPALLNAEAALATVDGQVTPEDADLEAIASEVARLGRPYAFRERHYRVVGQLAVRILAIEARLDRQAAPKATAK